jgi:UDP-2,4-diacetamido-2,4,6-trideoxy-beta-L-altropyranose hydrolase
MNILIRADSSSHIGLGHIMRDIVLATQYPEAHITFACQALDGNIMDRIPYPVHILKSNDPQELIDLIQLLQISRVIFDHYDIDETYEKKVKDTTNITIVALDDTYSKHHCDILINPNIYADEKRYNALVPVHTMIRCGKEFLLIREEFHIEKKIVREQIYDVCIAMGGADTSNLTLAILHILDPSLNICVITTTANAHLSELLSLTLDRENTLVHVNSNEVAKLLHESARAIITPSSIAHEAIFMELPFIAIQSVDNQSEFTDYLELEGFDVLRRFEKKSFEELWNRQK